ncbi:MAG: transglycosylase SLT domain-containing protein [Exiguobacterium profundum]|nr:MAG: transglycosylase SLT domain-containing protein [Exiguobacterium profundum]
MSRKLLLIGGGAALAYWAYQRGYAPQLGPVIEAARDGLDRILPDDLWDWPERQRAAEAAAIREASGGQVVPILGPDETAQVNAYEGVLRANWTFVQPWARANLAWTAAIMRVENAGLQPGAVGDNGAAHGLMQVHVPTAETCRRAGYVRFEATAAVLHTVEGGIYFGTAELDRLSKLGKPLDWIIKAYNGGAGWEGEGASYRAAREAYYKRVQRAFVELYAGEMA